MTALRLRSILIVIGICAQRRLQHLLRKQTLCVTVFLMMTTPFSAKGRNVILVWDVRRTLSGDILVDFLL